jgi:uncharacterized damage-inducible protein DinB
MLPESVATTLSLLDAEREGLLAAVERVPPDLRDQRPGAMRWSIAEVLEHLVTVERGIAKLIATRGRQPPPPDAPTPVLLDAPRIATLRNRGERLEAPERVRPSGSVTAADSLTALAAARAALRQAVLDADPAILERSTHTHPVLGPLCLRDWAQFVAHHEARHTAQVLEISEALTQ